MKIKELNQTLSNLFHESVILLELKDQTAKKWYDKSYCIPKDENFIEGLIYGVRINDMIEFDFSVKSIDNLFKSFFTNFINKYKVKCIDYEASQREGLIKYYTKETAQKYTVARFKETRASNGIMYSTNYGIGIWFIFMPMQWITNSCTLIESKLKELNIPFSNEFSDAQWVYRYIINGNYLDHNKIIESINQ